jgi:hypothetical protein
MSKPAPKSISSARNPLASRPVSPVSKFGDDVWELDCTNKSKARSSRIINWNASLGIHGRLADERFANLLNTCKLLVYALRNGKAVHGRLKGSTLVSIGTNLISFVRWMVFQKFERFSDLSGDDVLRYRAFVHNNPGRFVAKKGTWLRPPEAKQLHPRTMQLRMQPIVYLVELKSIVGDAPRWNPELQPGPDLGSSKTSKPIPRIPDEIATPLFQVALTWWSCPHQTGHAASDEVAWMNSRGESILSARCGWELL